MITELARGRQMFDGLLLLPFSCINICEGGFGTVANIYAEFAIWKLRAGHFAELSL